MDTNELKSIATGALTGYWPKHLGLNTDAEKIDWLARQVEKLADEAVDADELTEKLDDAEEDYRETVEELADVENCAECKLRDEHKKAKIS